jgi:endonuclease G, mitochondrial
MKYLALIFLCVSFSVGHQAEASDSDHAYGGIPSKEAFLERQAYIVQFDNQRKTPRWVAYHVKPENLVTPKREGAWKKYRNDPDVEGESSDEDYKGQFNTWRNYANGHLVPYFVSGGDRDGDGILAQDGDEDDAQAVFEINYRTNLAPQHHHNFNGSGGLWYKLETYVRKTLLRDKQKEVWVFAGTIYGQGVYDVIGNGVEVPPMFFKIIITEEEGVPKILAFLFPHQIKKHGEIGDFLVSVNHIESMTGLDFFHELNNEELERESTFKNWE